MVGCLATAGLVTLPKVLEGYGTLSLPSAAAPPRVESLEEVKAAGTGLLLGVYTESNVTIASVIRKIRYLVVFTSCTYFFLCV